MNFNFKDTVEKLLNRKATNLITKVVEAPIEITETSEEASTEIKTEGALQTDNYLTLIELIKLTSQSSIKTQPTQSLFTAKSVLIVFAFLLTSILVQLDNALADDVFSFKEGIQVAIALIGAISTVAARGSEGNTGIYTPNYMLGLNKEDYSSNISDNTNSETTFF